MGLLWSLLKHNTGTRNNKLSKRRQKHVCVLGGLRDDPRHVHLDDGDGGDQIVEDAHQDNEARVIIGVCGAVDCVSEGGGAALLEIEELCEELDGRVVVKRTACLNCCGVGPNVAIRSAQRGYDVHFRVNSVEKCAEVVQGAAADAGQRDNDESLPAHVVDPRLRLLRRRADGARWDALCKLAKRGAGGGKLEACEKALLAERQAAGGCSQKLERAERRHKRLQKFAERAPSEPSESTRDANAATVATGRLRVDAATFKRQLAAQFH